MCRDDYEDAVGKNIGRQNNTKDIEDLIKVMAVNSTSDNWKLTLNDYSSGTMTLKSNTALKNIGENKKGGTGYKMSQQKRDKARRNRKKK